MSTLSPRRRREIHDLRLISQRLAVPCTSPLEVAAHMTCLQGQQLWSVEHAIAIRSGESAATPEVDTAAVRRAFDDGQIVRGYPMRSTIFATSAADMAWMIDVTGPSQLRANARSLERFGIADEQSQAALADAARETIASHGGALTREELWEGVHRLPGLSQESGSLYRCIVTLMMRGDVVYGPRAGKNHLLVDAETWLPEGSGLAGAFNGQRDAAIGQWFLRYATSHGPISLRDFCWWTKLGLTETRRAAESVLPKLEQYGVDARGEDIWGRPGLREEADIIGEELGATRYLPAFDEMVLGFPDRSAVVDMAHHERLAPGNNGVFRNTIHSHGEVIGTWSRSGRTIEHSYFDGR